MRGEGGMKIHPARAKFKAIQRLKIPSAKETLDEEGENVIEENWI